MRNSGQLSHTITGFSGGNSFDNNTSLNLSLVTDDHRAGVYIFGQNRHRSGYDYDGDGFTELPKLKNQTVGFRSYFKTSTYSKLTFEYHHLQEFRRGGDMLNRPPHEANIAEQLEHAIDGGSLKFDYFSPNEKHRFSVFTSAANTDPIAKATAIHSVADKPNPNPAIVTPTVKAACIHALCSFLNKSPMPLNAYLKLAILFRHEKRDFSITVLFFSNGFDASALDLRYLCRR